MKLTFSSILILLISGGLFAQSKADFNQKFLEANYLMGEKLWYQSIDIWKALHDREPDNGNVMYKLGYCYLQTANEKLKSLPFLEAASSMSFSKNYDSNSSQEQQPPVEVVYYLGRAYHLNYQMDKAISSYNLLLSQIPEKHYLHADALRQIEMCEEAKAQVANPKNYIITNLGPLINTAANEYSPVISLDESALFFTSRRMRRDSSNQFFVDSDTGEFMEDIYASYKDIDGKWSEAEMLEISMDGHEATIGVSADGQTLYVYVDEAGDGSIMKSQLVGETWTAPEKLSSNINSDDWETHATITADYQTLYYVSNRASHHIGKNRNIYRCVKLPDGEWSKPLILGDEINSTYDEESPFISADGRTLYFSSKGHNSMGGFDIFYATLADDGTWSRPVNIGYPLNTVDDDVFFVPTANGKRAYYSSEKEEGYGLKDIYMIELPDSPVETDLAVLKGYIFKPEGEALPRETLVRVTNEQTGEVTEYRPRQRDGAYVAVLPPCIAYHIEYLVSGDVVHEDFVNVPCESAYTEIEKEIYLLPVYLDGQLAGYEADVEDVRTDIPVAFVPDTDKGIVPVVPGDKTVVFASDVKFERFFGYDIGEFEKSADDFYDFINDVVAVIDREGSITLVVESSASTVPSSKYASNEVLTRYRNAATTARIKAALERREYTTEQFSFATPIELVSGPKYGKDAWNKEKYAPFQYVKVSAK